MNAATCTTEIAAGAFGIAPNNNVNTKHLACAADAAINFGLGFIPGYNAAKLIGQAETEFVSSKRAAIYKKIQAIIAQDVPFVALDYPPYIYATSSNVKGFAVNPGGAYRLENVYLG